MSDTADEKKVRSIGPLASSNADMTYDSVRDYYGKVLNSTKDLKTSACTAAKAPPHAIRALIKKVPDEINAKYYGCGTALPFGIEGLCVLDLGSGSGRDCYVAAAMVGEMGSVIGIDMTDEQLEVANQHINTYCSDTLHYANANLKFVKGYIEFLEQAGIANQSLDLVISNCVVNLSPDKEKVIQGVYNALRNGGEFYFSDVYADRRLPASVRQNEILWGECISGALYIEDFKRICHRVGFTDPRVVESAEIKISDPNLSALLGNTRFYSITYRLFKLDDLETLCEDYGQVAIYQGSVEHCPNAYILDDHHVFEAHRPMLVCGNTASMLENSYLAPHFQIIGNRDRHFGLFDCGPSLSSSSSSLSASNGLAGGCEPGVCGPSGCC